MVLWNDIKIAEKGFLINLSHRIDRYYDSITEFKSLNISGIERFEAIKYDEDTEKGWKIRGCTQSHIDILKEQVKNNWSSVIIFEDDFCLDISSKNDFNISNFWINNIINFDFDILFLGATLLDNSTLINDYILKPKKFVQATAYICKLNASKLIIDNFNYLNENSILYGEAIDSFYSFLSTREHWRENPNLVDYKFLKEHTLKIYFSFPIIFSQRPSHSDIMNRYVNYKFYNKQNNLKYYPKN